jgi:hypothetical protein
MMRAHFFWEIGGRTGFRGTRVQSKSMGLEHQSNAIFESLWQDYVSSNPQAKRIYDLLLERERAATPAGSPRIEALANDHIALRTYNLPKVGIQALAQHFKKIGYDYGGEYFFESKKLYAQHFQHNDSSKPRVFISELELEKMSPFVRETAMACAAQVSEALISKPEILWSGRPWKADHATYQKLLAESEYAAWMYAFGYRANHFTVSFNQMKTFKDLPELNTFLKSNGFPLNSSGGEVKGNPTELLEQSSTLAEKTKVPFSEGPIEIPCCYYEFARRYPDASGQLYQGFVAASADKIFESTDVSPKR